MKTQSCPECAPQTPDLSVNLGGLLMKNPVTVASGTFGAGQEYADFFDVSRLGAITTKGVSSEPWAGNDAPRIAETPSGMLNSIGLQNPGVEAGHGGHRQRLGALDPRLRARHRASRARILH